jgi:hypothetical protein
MVKRRVQVLAQMDAMGLGHSKMKELERYS